MFDPATIFGIIIGLGGILVGNFLDGGHAGSLFQGTAALIVFGGTFGATLVSNTFSDIKKAIAMLPVAFREGSETQMKQLAAEVVAIAQLARRESILVVETKLNSFTNPFMKNVFRYMIDGIEPDTLRKIFEKEIEVTEKRTMVAAKVWSDAGGYAPTIGIIGAVLGLIHVMANLSDTSQLGRGIAVAFVATIYGVGSANLLFIPLAHKIRSRIKAQSDIKKMILEGAIAISSGLNPYIIEEKMRAFTGDKSKD